MSSKKTETPPRVEIKTSAQKEAEAEVKKAKDTHEADTDRSKAMHDAAVDRSKKDSEDAADRARGTAREVAKEADEPKTVPGEWVHKLARDMVQGTNAAIEEDGIIGAGKKLGKKGVNTTAFGVSSIVATLASPFFFFKNTKLGQWAWKKFKDIDFLNFTGINDEAPKSGKK